ncbi:ATP-dependent zinc metalloprotease FtsH [Chryseobacterium gwangjuense]|uniref:ATP-dependent zinc metalloprotease FtsH n=1 Tax=Chryseobacterium gwangjuense TaxID=1069980 RepID=UPI001E37C39A|nr:ATP-dependent zinc metalloprotease FtsH [Chryseobacterium gwangjuense]MCE3075374.1 ATP-dependent zinc metalloprotease FtsH [Chryseobacterium gwangjuense]
MNNKGFNWFFPIIIIALLLFVGSNFLGGDGAKSIDEDGFFREMQAGKVQNIIIYKDTEKADVFLTKAAKSASVDKAKQNDPLAAFSVSPKADFTVKYGDLQLFLQKFDKVKATSPAIATTKDYGTGKNPMMEILIQALIWITILGIFYFFLFRKMGSGGGPGGQIFSIGKSKAKLFDEKERIQVTFKDVAGLEGAKEEVQEVVDFLKNSEKYTKLGGKIPKGVLLVGPPGTGKTLLAKAVAGEAKVPFFSLSGSDFVEMFVGVGASRVRDLFAQAKAKSPAIIFIDEIDAIGRARGKNNFSGGNDERENTLNQLLTEMDGFGTDTNVIVMAATNRADILDKALMRAGRFDRSIYVDLPELHERRQIFDVHLKKIKLDDNVDREFLAKQTPGFSGADIANVCNEAALIAARNNHTSVTKQDFLDAVDRIIGGLEKKNKAIKPSEKRRVAYHEAGHATISWLVEHASPLLKVTIVPRGRSLGAAWYLPEERQLTTTEQMLDEMCATLGGRAAEQVIFDNISTGALSDLESVTKRAQAMVTIYGLSPNIGNISYYDSSGQSEYSFGKPYSEETAKKIDIEIKAIIEDQYDRAIRILTENKDKLDALANKLLEKEVIFREDLEEVFGKRAWDPELTEKPVTNTIPDGKDNAEEITIKDKEEESEIQAPESSSQL